MINIEEQIWDYIDGNLTEDQQTAIQHKIATDETYKSVYQELLAIHQQMETMELEEPSMSFTRNVMEQVQLEMAPVSLKTKVDGRIIYCISGFFILLLLSVLIYVISQSHLTLSKWTFSIDIERFITPVSIRTFFFIDLIIGFLCIDKLVRRKRI